MRATACFLHILGHIDADHGLFVVEEVFRQGRAPARSCRRRWAQENEAADGAVGVAHAGAVCAEWRPKPAYASSWPTTRSLSRSGMCTSFWISPSNMRVTGMPVHLATMRAISFFADLLFEQRVFLDGFEVLFAV